MPRNDLTVSRRLYPEAYAIDNSCVGDIQVDTEASGSLVGLGGDPFRRSAIAIRVDRSVGELVEAIVPDAREHGVGLEPTGDEILVDIQAFVARQGVLLRVTAPGPTVLLPQNVRAVRHEDAIRCGKRVGRCRVLDDRVYVRLDSLVALPGGALAATVTYTHTDHRPTGNTFIGFVQTRLELTRKGDRWEIRRRDVIMST